jgi:transglutaminase-like putative cysteine protease
MAAQTTGEARTDNPGLEKLLEDLLMLRVVLLATCLLPAAAALSVSRPTSQATRPPAVREFLFTYAATVTGLTPGQSARLWLPVALSKPEQTVTFAAWSLPGPAQLTREKHFGNAILYVETTANAQGKIPVWLTYHIRRREVRGDTLSLPLTAEERTRYLQAETRVPVGGRPAEVLLRDRPLPREPYALARRLYDLVNNHMEYSKKGTGWGQGDAVWACDSRYGNCTDFHSLFISLARTVGIPAKFEIGFALPAERGRGEIAGYHCWAWCQPQGRGWLPVDISQANQARSRQPELVDYCFGNLTADRVAFSQGRDLILSPPQKGAPLNFFIYPYVEVDGRAWPSQQVQLRFTYEDVADPLPGSQP